MWNLFFYLLISLAVGLVILYGIKYFRDQKGFDMWFNVGQCILRLFVGAVVCFIAALAAKFPWIIYVAPCVLALLSNYWMAWLDKKVR